MSSNLIALPLPEGVRSSLVPNQNGLDVHVLEAGFETPGRPAVLLLHGFPELAYSWRKVMAPLALAGYHVIAPDLRGYGRTTGWDARFDGDVASFRTHNLARDALGLVRALGHRRVEAVVGHDVGAMVAAYATLARPDVFKSVVLMSFPFDGPPPLPDNETPAASQPNLDDQLAALQPPRRDSMAYFSTRSANDEMLHAEAGLHAFLRAYFHVKSADFASNRPCPLSLGTAEELATLPTYYIMDRGRTMAQTVAPDMPSPGEIQACRWLTEDELAVYTREFSRTGFQGGLNWFRCHAGALGRSELELFSGRTIAAPSLFLAGQADWGMYRKPGALERMRTTAFTRMAPIDVVSGAGHWPQQEQPQHVVRSLLRFLRNDH